MAELMTGVVWIAVVLGAVVSFLVGWVWYSFLFGKKWAEAHGIDMNAEAKMPFAAMGVNFIGLFLMSWFVGVTAVSSALFTVILATLAFAVLLASNNMFAKKPVAIAAIDSGFWIVALAVMIAFQAIF